ENTSNKDWQGMDMNLVAGRPVSFTEDLYSAIYLNRPVVQPQLYAGLAPQMHEEGLAADYAAAAAAAPPMAMTSGSEAGGGGGGGGKLSEDQKRGESTDRLAKSPYPLGMLQKDARRDYALLNSAVAGMASGERIGELFEFHLKEPVTLSRSRSAMLPI